MQQDNTPNDEIKYATVEDKKRALKKIKWMYFKAQVGIPLILLSVVVAVIITLSLLFPDSEDKSLAFIGQFIEWVLIFSIFYLLVGIVRYIKFVADTPVINNKTEQQ